MQSYDERAHRIATDADMKGICAYVASGFGGKILVLDIFKEGVFSLVEWIQPPVHLKSEVGLQVLAGFHPTAHLPSFVRIRPDSHMGERVHVAECRNLYHPTWDEVMAESRGRYRIVVPRRLIDQ